MKIVINLMPLHLKFINNQVQTTKRLQVSGTRMDCATADGFFSI